MSSRHIDSLRSFSATRTPPLLRRYTRLVVGFFGRNKSSGIFYIFYGSYFRRRAPSIGSRRRIVVGTVGGKVKNNVFFRRFIFPPPPPVHWQYTYSNMITRMFGVRSGLSHLGSRVRVRGGMAGEGSSGSSG